MKKTIISMFILLLITAILLLITAQIVNANVHSSSKESTQDISLTRRDPIRPQPRTLSLETFTASYDSQTLTINSSYYTGSVQVIITGPDGLTHSYAVADAHSEYIDISALYSGSYTLTITTSGSIYTGDFEL